MKSFLLIGMGKFGSCMCKSLVEHDCEVMIVDADEEKVAPLSDIATSTRIADCRKREVLESFDVAGFDACFVCIGEDFQSSLEVTDHLKELGAKRVVSMASSEIQAKFLLRNGADSIVFPERDTAQRIAVSTADDRIFEYFGLASGSSLYEIAPPKRWLGKTIVEVNVRVRFGVNIAAVCRKNGSIDVPSGEYVFREDERLWVLGKDADVERLLKRAE